MDARSSIEARLPIRHSGATNAALHLVEIFKKTSCAAGLKPGGRDAAKDMVESDGIPLLDADVGSSNVKLTGAGRAKRKTKWKARQTNPMSGALVSRRGGARERQCYADI